ncbi:MAG TPA: HEAT repeat domain-containing protein [Solirubrobacteraceae bacterium]
MIAESGAALRAVLRGGDEREQRAALSAFAYVADPASRNMVVEIVLDGRRPAAVRSAGVRALAALAAHGDGEALELLSGLLLDDEGVVVDQAVEEIAALKDARVPTLIAARLREARAAGRRAPACRALGEFWRRYELDLAGTLTRRDRRSEAIDAIVSSVDERRG